MKYNIEKYGGSKFDYSTIVAESSWEPRGVLQPEQKIEDSANNEEMQRLQWLRRGRSPVPWSRRAGSHYYEHGLAKLERFARHVLAGSYFSVAGALVGLINPGRMTLFGTLLIVWGLVKEGVLGKAANADPTQAVYVYPTILVALVCAFSTIKYNGNKATVRGQAASIAKPLKSSAKSKLK
ncbi:hypothetical protein GW17_00019671 [Ensete ventricosum]|nr:hypothetical protein GW17_00019671 [Ensete ventricosum]